MNRQWNERRKSTPGWFEQSPSYRRHAETGGRNESPGGKVLSMRWVLSTIVCMLLFCSVNAAIFQNQLPPPPLPVDPTPLPDLLTQQEKQAFTQATQPKRQVEVCLEISSIHLDAAHAAIKSGDFHKAEQELDIFNKACAQALSIALAQEKGRRGLAKKVEQQLYKHLRLLDQVERLFPSERVAFAEAATKQAKQLRVQALNATFDSGNVLNDPGKDRKDGKVSPSPDGGQAHLIPRKSLTFTMARQRASSGIPGDYLNEEEDDHVREAQEADERIKVFMKIADRRLLAITGTPAVPTDKKAQKKAEEEAKEWGPLPKVSKAELLKHYSRAVEEAVAKLEDAHERNPKATTISKALTLLRDATDRHLQTLRSLDAEIKDENEKEALRYAIEQAEWANKGAKEGLKGK